MRTLVFQSLFLFTLFSYQAFAANYYLSPNGDDTDSGLSPNRAWRTIDHLNANLGSINPGDSILFERGGVFRGEIQMWRSGLPGQPIVFSAYGPGERPVLSAAKELTGWTNIGGGIWKAHCASCTDEVTNVFIDGKFQPIGRYPNRDAADGGYLIIDVGNSNNEIQDYQLNAPSNGYWNNAEVVVRSNRWVIDRVDVQYQSGNTVHFSNYTNYEMEAGYGYFFQNHLATLDREGEWHYDSNTKDLYLFYGSQNPNSRNIEISYKLSNMLLGSQDYLTITGLEFTGSRLISIQANHCDHMVFTDNLIYGSGKDAAWFHDCQHLVFEHNEIRQTNNNGLNVNQSSNASVQHNTITLTAMVPGMGESGDGTHSASRINGNNSLFAYNRIDSVGYLGIRFEGSYNIINRNYITYSCMIKDDGAGIYTWNDGGTPFVGNQVTENIILYAPGAKEGTPDDRGIGQGIYIDDRSEDILIANNTVGHVSDNGIFVHNSKEIDILNNVVLNSGENQLLMQHDVIAGAGATIRNCTVSGNQFVGQSDKQKCMKLRSMQNDVDIFGSFSNNLHVNPFDSMSIKRGQNPNYPSGHATDQHYPLNEWRALTGLGSGSVSTTLQYPTYHITDSIGQNLISNVNFPFGTGNWTSWGNYNNNCLMTWDPAQLDAGCMKMQFTQYNGSSYIEAYHYLGQVDDGKTYQLTFTAKGAVDGKRIEIRLQKDAPPYSPVAHSVSYSVESSRKEFQIFIQPVYSEANTNLIIRIYEDCQALWLDNVNMHEVSLDTIASQFVELITNPSTQPLYVPLNKGKLNVSGNILCEGVTIPPYRSIILMENPAPDAGPIYQDPSPVIGVMKTLYSCDWLHFEDPATTDLLASANSNSQYLGDSFLDTHVHQGPVRNFGGKYTLNRSWVLNTTIRPNFLMSVRLYATFGEVEDLIASSPQINSAEDIGITRYYNSSQPGLMNEKFSDNLGGNTEFYPATDVTVMPYKNGYYFEVAVTELGEFWLSRAPLTSSSSFPVEFSSFEAELLEPNLAMLEWTTASEQNSSHFVVQRSVDKDIWEEVGRVKAAGNSNTTRSYQHPDRVAFTGRVYYRLKEVDLDGSLTFSSIKTLTFGEFVGISMDAYPNPAKDFLQVNHFGPGEEEMDLSLLNAFGQVVRGKVVEAGENESRLDLTGVVPGIYYLQLSYKEEIVSKKVVVGL